MLKWLDASEATKQADDAVAEIGKLVPPAELANDANSRAKHIRKLSGTINKHRHKNGTTGYNIYQKSKFANRVKWLLRDAGYPDDFIDSLIRLLII